MSCLVGTEIPTRWKKLTTRWPICGCVIESEVAQSCPTLCDPMDCSLPGSSVRGNFPGKSTGVGCNFLLQGVFPTQGLNPALPHCRQTLYQLSHQGSPCNKLTQLQRIGLKEVGTHWTWNWRLTVPKTIKMMLVRPSVTNFRPSVTNF